MGTVFGLVTVGVMVAAGPVGPLAQSVPSLAALTAPSERLPTSCRLEPVTERFVMHPGVRDNPWVGTRRPTLGILRQMVDGQAGPTYGLSGPALLERLADDVVEGYRARYLAADEVRIDVYAVRFRDADLTVAATMNRLITSPPARPRLVVGSIAALVFQSSERARQARGEADNGCLQAVTAHISTVKRGWGQTPDGARNRRG